MAAYVIRRLLISIPVLIAITIAGFTVLSLTPGDPLLARMDPETIAQLSATELDERRRALGLDQPIPIRYLVWLSGAVQGDLGFSINSGRAVADELGARAGPTLLLMGSSILIALVIGITFGVVSAVRQFSKLDYALTTITLAMISTPTFVLGLILIYTLGVSLRVLPVGGMQTLGAPFDLADRARHLVMPATILGMAMAAPLMRYTRASMVDVLSGEYMTTARAKGLPRTAILVRHGLRNALIPIITLLGLLLPELVAGAVITEQVFAWPGMGTLAVRAAADRDPALMMGIVMVIAVAVLLTSLVADLAYAVADPRVRLDRRR